MSKKELDGMVRATIAKTRTVGRPPSGRAVAAKTGAVKQRGAPKILAMTASASKEELRARVEKLERANATLRVKNKELRIVAVEAAEQVDALTLQLANSERRAGRQTRHEAPAEAVETREILRPTRGRRKARGAAAEDNGHDNHDRGGEAHTSWGAHDHAEA
jgi:hypothetical protein